MLKKVATSLVFAVGLMFAPGPARAECSPDNYGSCGENPPKTDRVEPAPAPAPAPAPSTPPAPPPPPPQGS